MAAQKQKKNLLAESFAFLNANKPKTQLIKVLNSIDSSRSYGRLSQNSKTGGFRELFLPENDFETCSTVDFQKNIQIFEGWKPYKVLKLQV